MQILFSCCNKGENPLLGNSSGLLYLLDAKTLDFAEVPLGLESDEHGATGIAAYDGGCLLALQNNLKKSLAAHELRLVMLDKSLDPQRMIDLPNIVDTHSMVVRDQCCYLASTGNDSIGRWNLEAGEFDTFWQYPDHGEDKIHINGLAWHQGQLLASCFGQRTEQSKGSATEGYLFFPHTNEKVVEGIHHPHSVSSYDDSLWWCESGAGRVWCDGDLMLDFDQGYVRGLAVQDDWLAVGISRQRLVSRSSEQQYEPHPEKIGQCEVRLYRRDSDGRLSGETSVDLSSVTDEIYDLSFWPS